MSQQIVGGGERWARACLLTHRSKLPADVQPLQTRSMPLSSTSDRAQSKPGMLGRMPQRRISHRCATKPGACQSIYVSSKF